MKKSISIGLMVFCATVAWAGNDEAKQFASMNKKIQVVQDSIPPMLAKLESSLQAQIKTTNAATQENIKAIQKQIAQVQADTNTKLTAQSKSSVASVATAQKSLQSSISDLQGQIVQLQSDTDKKLAALNKAISGGK